ncbi:MAG: MBL fold metallo-hydrolase [Nitrospirae bacterium]|nr:MBL fold metallo-hydrolase [Nitrospirota bacterium]
MVGVLPEGKGYFLVDVANAERVFEFFKESQIFEFIVITHSHADHLKGLYNLIENWGFKSRRLYINFDRGPNAQPSQEYIHVLRNLEVWRSDFKLESLPINTATEINNIPLSITILHPTYSFLAKMIAEQKLNEASVVLKLSYKDRVIILTGDIEKKGINELISNCRNALKCDLLKIPHHGAYSADNSLEALVDSTRPKFAVISSGQNKFNHPSEKSIEYLAKKQIKIFHTSSREDAEDAQAGHILVSIANTLSVNKVLKA